MGAEWNLLCPKCGTEYSVRLGIGYVFPLEYKETVNEIKAGKYGTDWQKLFGSVPGAAVNAEAEFYVCAFCGGFSNEKNLSVYSPKGKSREAHTDQTGSKYCTLDDLKEGYRLVKSYVHKCPECGKRMHKYRPGDLLKCPHCKEKSMDIETGALWD